VKTAGG
jgi:hypothetical protein